MTASRFSAVVQFRDTPVTPMADLNLSINSHSKLIMVLLVP
jgi:hypothetical protein